jgi:hypothetical protein
LASPFADGVIENLVDLDGSPLFPHTQEQNEDYGNQKGKLDGGNAPAMVGQTVGMDHGASSPCSIRK